MKYGSAKFFCLIIWVCISVLPAFANDRPPVSWASIVLEPFNGDEDATYLWRTDASRFASSTDDTTFPVLAYVEAWPVAVFGYNRGANADPIRSLGINGRFDRQGFNWIDLYPVLASDPDAGPAEIPIPGIVRNFDMWVWGANLRYYIEIYVRDYRGVVHAMRLGDISFVGWKNLNVNVPTNIIQTRRTLPSYAGLTFVKFRIWTQPVERVDNFFIYFKQLKILTDVYSALFDGNDLANPDFVDQIWSEGTTR